MNLWSDFDCEMHPVPLDLDTADRLLAGTVALLELGGRWRVEWPREVVERSGVYAYRALRPAVDDGLA